MKIYLGYDHRAVKLSEEIIAYLIENGHEVNLPFDNNELDDDYPDISSAICKEVKKDKGSVGILVCGSGVGMAMAANKEKGIRAVLTLTKEFAYFSRRHEDVNVLVLAAGVDDGKVFIKKPNVNKTLEIVETFLSTPFEGDRHVRRLAKIKAIEDRN